MIKLNYFIVILIFLCSCSGIKNEKEMFQILSNNPYSVQRESAGFCFSAKYLPAEFLAWKDMKDLEANYGSPAKSYDGFLSHYNESMTFLFDMGPDNKSNHADIMKYGISAYKDYQQRVLDINFNIEKFIYLEQEGKKYYPVLSNLENHYGMKSNRLLYVVFPKINESQNFKLVYEDVFFESGIHQFHFQKSVFQFPELTFIPS